MNEEDSDRESLIANKADGSARSEIQEYLDFRQQRRHILPRAALVGLCAGAVALLFRVTLAGASVLRNEVVLWSHRLPVLGWIFPLLIALLGALVSVTLTRRYAPEAGGSGIPHLEAVLRRLRVLEWRRVLPVKFFGSVFAIGSGLTLGIEGPTVQMCGAVGDAVSRLLKVHEQERLTLISAGAGAGLAAAFNAPLSGVIFALEELRGDFNPIILSATLVAAIISDVLVRMGKGQFPIFTVPSYPAPPLTSLPVFALLGVISGFLGVLFNRSLLAVSERYRRLPVRLMMPAVALTGGIVGLVGWFSTNVLGSGEALIDATFNGDVLFNALPLLFGVRFFLTIISYGTGAPGGIFAPLLTLGVLTGLLTGQLAQRLLPGIAPIPQAFAVVGMAAYFSAIVRAPLTGIMLIVEMTGSYSLMLPLLVSCFSAYAIAEYMKELPIYEALLERDLKRSGRGSFLKRPVVVEFTVEPHSPFMGREIRSLGLPAGCIIVRCTDGKHELVPKANTRLQPYMRITAVIAPEASDALELLRQGCQTTDLLGHNID